MKYAIISDIHANLKALEQVVEDAKVQGCTDTVCLGDIVGNGHQPKECLDLIRGLDIPCVKGNFDQYCAATDSLDQFNQDTAEGLRWTREQLTEEDRHWLGALPLRQIISGFTVVHGSLDQPERWEYVFDKHAAARSFPKQSTPVCFYGHTHVPVAFVCEKVVRGGTFTKFKIQEGAHYFINVGSVGQPRDGIKKTAYVTYDLESSVVELRRLEGAG